MLGLFLVVIAIRFMLFGFTLYLCSLLSGKLVLLFALSPRQLVICELLRLAALFLGRPFRLVVGRVL